MGFKHFLESINILFAPKVKDKDLILFTKQFSIMLSAGLPISKCLSVLSEQVEKPYFRKVIVDVQGNVLAGHPLSTALSFHPEVFSQVYVALCKAAESSGKLDEALLKLSDILEKNRDLKSKFKTAMIYPIIIVIGMLGVFILMMVVVVPKLSELYTTMNVELPIVTRLMINLSNFMITNKLPLAFVVIFFSIFLHYFFRTQVGKSLWSSFSFGAPVLGNVNKLKEYALFSRTFGMLLEAGVPLLESLVVASRVVYNKNFYNAIQQTSVLVERGIALFEAMKQTKVFPSVIYSMVQVGEETGNLDSVLNKISSYYSNEADIAITRFSVAIEPIILVVLGVGVGLLILSVITPIYKITSAL